MNEQELRNRCMTLENEQQQLVEELNNQALVIRNMIERIAKLELTIAKDRGISLETVQKMHMPTHDDWTRE